MNKTCFSFNSKDIVIKRKGVAFLKKAMSDILTVNLFDSRLIILYFLNIADYFFTIVLISSGLFVEANPIMNLFISGAEGFVLKCVLPLLLVTFMHIRFCLNETRHPHIVKLMLDGIIVYYAVIDCIHIFWMSYMAMVFA